MERLYVDPNMEQLGQWSDIAVWLDLIGINLLLWSLGCALTRGPSLPAENFQLVPLDMITKHSFHQIFPRQLCNAIPLISFDDDIILRRLFCTFFFYILLLWWLRLRSGFCGSEESGLNSRSGCFQSSSCRCLAMIYGRTWGGILKSERECRAGWYSRWCSCGDWRSC